MPNSLSVSLLAIALTASTTFAQSGLDTRDRIFYPGDKENMKPLARKLAGNVWLDQREIWTSPFRMKKKDAKWWIGFGAATGALVATDRRSDRIFQNSPGQIRWGNRVSDIGSTYSVISVVAAFYGLGVWRDNQKARETGVLSGEALLDSLIVVEVLKTAAGRNRPDAAQHRGNFFSGGDSFPSGHAIEMWTFASVVSQEYSNVKWIPFVAYGLAGTVSAARFAAQKHYASDIVAGGAMGWFLGRYVYNTHALHAAHKHASFTPVLSPQFQPASRTYGVGITFVRSGAASSNGQ